jgi:alpha-beta hydrolase superfamily lysophospholipase
MKVAAFSIHFAVVVSAHAPAQTTRPVTQPATQPTTQPVTMQRAARLGSHDYVLHLPGIGGLLRIDFLLTGGLREAGVDGQIDVYDWTAPNPGLIALGAFDRNHEEARKVARVIRDRLRDDPQARITITSHSGGAGIAVWALEELPDDVHIDTLLMLAPALSPRYDLSRALRHVDRAYAFVSAHDPILGAGTRGFGTIDRVRTEAAGRVGFVMPEDAADPAQYAKLKTFSYDPAWMRYGNIGDHIGPMMRPFARRVLGPLLLTGTLPTVTTQPTTQPASR